jgi:hypothetical protein
VGEHFKTTEKECWERDGIMDEVTGQITSNVSRPNTESRYNIVKKKKK